MTYPRWFSIFAALLLATALLLVAGLFYAIRIVRQPDYPASIYDPSALMQDNAFRWHDRFCEVLIYGDSTANVGLDPRIITARTGLTACNIAASRPVVDDLGNIPLDAFLAHNPAPRFIVLQYGPETFYRAKSPWEYGPFTPMLMLSRDLPLGFTLRKMLRHPAETTQFLSFILQTRFFPHRLDVPYFTSEYNRMIAYSEVSNGRLDLGQSGESTCPSQPIPLHGPLDTAWPRELYRQYESRGIPVIIRAAPIPACDPQLALFQHDLAPYVDGNVETLPVSDFIAGGRHTTTQGSIPETLGLVHLIQSRQSKMLPVAP